MSEINNPISDINSFLQQQDTSSFLDDDFEEDESSEKPESLFQSNTQEKVEVVYDLKKPEKETKSKEQIVEDVMNKVEDMSSSNDIVTMFEPTYGKDIRIEYPDLDDVEEFKNLTASQLSFVWAYANKTSPYYKIQDEKEKISKCCLLAFRKRLGREQLEKYLEKDFPDLVVLAIPKMQKYNPSFRMRAKLLAERQFHMIDDMTSQVEGYGEIMTLDEKKKFADFINTSSSIIPKIVDQIENAYGVKLKVVRKKEEGGMTDMDKIMSED
jgi:hypothetical protein